MLLIAMTLALAVPQDDCKLPDNWSAEGQDQKPLQKAGDGLWIGGIAFAQDDIAAATRTLDEPTHSWGVKIRFTPAGNAKFILAQRCGVGHIIEISLDRKMLVRPILNEPITGGELVMMGGFDFATVETLAKRISGH